MNALALIRARIRRLLESSVPPHMRLQALRLAALVFPDQIGAQAFLRLASEFAESGRKREEMLCWRILRGMSPADARISMSRLSSALDADDLVEVKQALKDATEGPGIPPHGLIRFAGQLAHRGHTAEAGRLLVRVAKGSDTRQLVAQSPSVLSARLVADIGRLGAALASAGEPPVGDLLSLARLCFAFRNPEVAAALLARVSSEQKLDALDQVALLHAQSEVDAGALRQSKESLAELLREFPGNPDALGMLVRIAMVAGEPEVARDAMLRALTVRHGDPDLVQGISGDCCAILEVLAELREQDAAVPQALLERIEPGDGGIPKVFLCGFGWSGSGALYDEIRGTPGICEFEGAGFDAIINEDAESEITFVQGSGGLGDLWKVALDTGQIPWGKLWDTFNLHVAGLSSIGYAEYKCCAAARNHVRRYGPLHTAPYRTLLERYARLRRAPSLGGLHASLLEATESLCAMLVRGSGGQVVLFNNAVFGRDPVMLEIFRSRRAAIVYRDPRDVYVDRRINDLNHWRTPAQLATFYAYGLRRYTTYRSGRGKFDPDLREVSFERFVKNDRFRARVRAWLLGRLGDGAATRYFDPQASSRNIGIHVGALSAEEEAQLQPALEDCRALDGFADTAWEAAA